MYMLVEFPLTFSHHFASYRAFVPPKFWNSFGDSMCANLKCGLRFWPTRPWFDFGWFGWSWCRVLGVEGRGFSMCAGVGVGGGASVVLCCSNVVQVLLSLNPFQLNLEFGTTHRVQMCHTSKQV